VANPPTPTAVDDTQVLRLPAPAPVPPAGYLDAVGGQPVLPVATEAWLVAASQAWSDPARLHHPGRVAGQLLDAARTSFARLLGIQPEEVFLTSSGPTALATAIEGLGRRPGAPRRVVASAVESMAVLAPADQWADVVDLVPVDRTGRLDEASFAAALERPASVACVQAANPEVGTRQDLVRAAALARAAGVPLLVHAIQVIGRGPVPAHWDLLAASARDWGGPAGVGVLAVRRDVRWRPEESPDRGWLSGFPDIPGAVAAARAWEYVQPVADHEAARLYALTERIREALPSVGRGIEVVGHPTERVPHIVTFGCDDLVGEQLVHELSRHGISVASGSACTSDARMPSQVLPAMGLTPDASVRVSLPLGCSVETVDRFLDVLPDALAAARG